MITISKILVYIIQVLNQLNTRITTHSFNPNPYELEDLAPKDDHDKEVYVDSLVWAIKNQRIKNLALTGSYGSGKSTILRTLEKKHPEFKYLNISLAAFGDDEEQKDIKYDSIEKSILQQMFYREKSKNLQHSRFEKIKNHKTIPLLIRTLLTTLWLFSIVWLLQNEHIIQLSILDSWKPFIYEHFNVGLFTNLMFLVFTGILFVTIFQFLKILNKMEVSKLDAKGGEIAKRQFNSEISFLNKHLDEILYFFEDTTYKVVIFEDLDRFQKYAQAILTKLREINTLLNNSKQINRHIIFIYAIKDDMFKDDKTRTKFFDLIIPVIPIIDSSNSETFLLDKFGNIKEISKKFIEDISLYIDDMRTLNNIYNEYVIYSDQIEIKSIKRDKILGMIIYKNLYPEDFAKLNQKEGMLYDVFKNKSNLVITIINQNNEKIDDLQIELAQIEKEHLQNIKELRALYIKELLLVIPYHYDRTITIENERVSINSLDGDKYFNSFIKQTNIIINNNYINKSFSDIEKIVGSNLTYHEREKLIPNRSSRINTLQHEIEHLEEINQKLSTMTLVEIIQNGYSAQIFTNHLKDQLLLKYFIKHGYIDELYPLAISHFHEGSLSKEDMNFVLQIKDGSSLYFTYPLLKIDNVIKRLDGYFDRPEILNIFLVNYIIKHNMKSELDKILEQIIKKNQRAIEFLGDFIGSSTLVPDFIRILSKKWSDFAIFIDKESDYSDEKKTIFLDNIIRHADIDDIVSMDKSSILSNFISQKTYYLYWKPQFDEINDESKKTSLITSLKIKFARLEIPSEPSPLLQTIYETNSYTINPEMIELIIEQLGDAWLSKSTDLKTSNFTTIKQSSCLRLLEYINENLNEYVANVFLIIKENTKESEETIIELLNNESIELENKHAIIAKTETKISDITSISQELWTSVFEHSKIEPIWDNLTTYFEKTNTFDSVLINFINLKKNYSELSKYSLVHKEFETHLLENNDVTDEAYEKIVESIIERHFELTMNNLSTKKVNALLNHNILYLTPQNFNALNERKARTTLIEKNINFFIENYEKFPIDTTEAIALVESQSIADEHKSKIIQTFDVNTLDESEKLAKLFYKIWKNKHEKLELLVLNALIDNLGINNHNLELQINLLNSQILFLSKDEIMSILCDLEGDYADIISSKGSELPINYYNEKLLSNLKELKYFVSSFNPKEKKFKINKKQK
ncbi:MAG TPA: hypothetical protein DDZ71_10880 [Sulfuricurvum sp.]|nr:hypothetical protein [Sulfuricurvum sp.]